MRHRVVMSSSFAVALAALLMSATQTGLTVADAKEPEAAPFVWCYLSDLSDNGYLTMQGSSNETLVSQGAFHFLPWEPWTDPDCIEARAELWIDGVEDAIKVCTDGRLNPWGACQEGGFTEGFGASATVVQEARANYARFYHNWSSYMNQTIYDRWGGGWSQPSRHTAINLGSSPREDCIAQNNYWDESTETCEFNPDGGNGSPIIVPVGKKLKYKLTSVAGGVRFDLDNDGMAEQVAWTRADSDFAFLAIDRNGDGQITNGSELFGDRTMPNATNGFLALDRLLPQASSLNPAAIEEGDPIYEHLLLWTDRNHNGRSESDELVPAKELLTRIGVGYMRVEGNVDKYGNEFLYAGWAERRTAPGKNEAKTAKEHGERVIRIYDVFLAMTNVAGPDRNN